jgi:hypothetical protein
MTRKIARSPQMCISPSVHQFPADLKQKSFPCPYHLSFMFPDFANDVGGFFFPQVGVNCDVVIDPLMVDVVRSSSECDMDLFPSLKGDQKESGKGD